MPKKNKLKLKKITTNIRPINIIERYSLINNTTNPGPLYSVIKPLTNSEGLSEKSKGRRFLSAKNRIKTKTITGPKINLPNKPIPE